MTNVTYPGVYIEEIPSGVRTISGVATSITAFIGRTLRGPLDTPVRVQSFGEFQRIFGGQWLESTLSYAVQQYFQNGGADALIVRVANSAGAASIDVASSGTALTFEAANPGTWGDKLAITIDHDTKDSGIASLFNLTIQEVEGTTVLSEEKFMNVSVLEANPRFVQKFLEQNSSLLRLTGSAPFDNPTDGDYDVTSDGSPGSDGSAVGKTQISDSSLEADREGLWALESVDLFNILCIPPFERETDVDQDTWDAALKYCQDHRAMLIVDPPTSWTKPSDISASAIGSVISERDKNAAIYFPRIQASDPLQENRIETFAPCGAVAGIFARTDASRGVWKAPAGQEATLSGVRALAYKMTDGENGILNPLGVNCLRNFATSGNTVWGARTIEGADNLASEWKYIPVRRTALYIEESLFRGTQWVVFEPNDEPLWAQIRLNIGAFMNNLFRQGAFQGKTPREAYFVKCDGETTTQDDINRGVVNILVGFAPLKPAEFVVIKIQQMAGQIEA